MIWNLSECKYNTELFNNQVCDSCYPAYPYLPLNEALIVATNIKKWLSADPDNKAIVHCKGDKSRSAIQLALYLFLDGKYAYPDDALIYVNGRLGIQVRER